MSAEEKREVFLMYDEKYPCMFIEEDPEWVAEMKAARPSVVFDVPVSLLDVRKRALESLAAAERAIEEYTGCDSSSW